MDQQSSSTRNERRVNSGRHREVFADAFQRQKVELEGGEKGVALLSEKQATLAPSTATYFWWVPDVRRENNQVNRWGRLVVWISLLSRRVLKHHSQVVQDFWTINSSNGQSTMNESMYFVCGKGEFPASHVSLVQANLT